VLVWSGLDTLTARDAYVANPTGPGYEDGVGRELRTNVLIGVTAALGVATVTGALFFTDWTSARRRSASRLQPFALAHPSGGAAGVIASF
jgi:hypothetical protein